MRKNICSLVVACLVVSVFGNTDASLAQVRSANSVKSFVVIAAGGDRWPGRGTNGWGTSIGDYSKRFMTILQDTMLHVNAESRGIWDYADDDPMPDTDSYGGPMAPYLDYFMLSPTSLVDAITNAGALRIELERHQPGGMDLYTLL